MLFLFLIVIPVEYPKKKKKKTQFTDLIFWTFRTEKTDKKTISIGVLDLITEMVETR